MKTMTNKELLALGNDLRMVRMHVLHKRGFTCEEIANVLGTKESVVRRMIGSTDNSNDTVNGEKSC